MVYKVMRSVNAEPVATDDGDEEVDWVGDWENVKTTCAARASLTDQPQKIRLVYRVIALNRAGEGQPSDAVLAVL